MQRQRFTYLELRACAILALLVAAFATRAPLILGIYALAAFILIGANVRMLSVTGSRETITAAALLISVLLTLPATFIRNPSVAFHVVAIAVSLGVAYILTRDLYVYARASWVTLVACQAYVIAYLASSGLEDFPLERILPDSSSNGITSYLIVLQANACASVYLLRRRTCLISGLVTLGICVVGYGRGSVLAAAALVTICVLFAIGRDSLAKTSISALLVLAIGLLVYLSHQEEIDTFVEVNTKIGAGLDDEPRREIITDYMRKIESPAQLFFGADYRGTSIENSYFGNPHNSYIRAHNIFGLPYLLCMLVLPLLLDRRKWPRRVRFFVYAMLVVILARAITEPLLFPTLFDFFYFALCFVLAQTSPRTSGEIAPIFR